MPKMMLARLANQLRSMSDELENYSSEMPGSDDSEYKEGVSSDDMREEAPMLHRPESQRSKTESSEEGEDKALKMKMAADNIRKRLYK